MQLILTWTSQSPKGKIIQNSNQKALSTSILLKKLWKVNNLIPDTEITGITKVP